MVVRTFPKHTCTSTPGIFNDALRDNPFLVHPNIRLIPILDYVHVHVHVYYYLLALHYSHRCLPVTMTISLACVVIVVIIVKVNNTCD